MVVEKSSSTNIGWRVQARFIIELHIKDLALLNMMQSFFGDIGFITINPKRNSCRFVVVNYNHITKTIIPHFNKYTLQSAKKIDFEFWKECVNIMTTKKHLTHEGFKQIICLKAVINLGLSNQLKMEFPNIIYLVRPDYIPNNDNLNPD
jgi:hypothetical protein